MFSIIIQIALICISLSMLGLVYRLIKGPSTPDRVVALDAIGINLIALIALLSISLDTSAYLEAILLLAIVSFIGTTAFSKFLEKEDIIEHDRNL
ncbi:Na(+)/H(+) antiporter subunit F1 [Peribacillus psychrosaccharolyticus]|uniref:Na(+)/H(+) antiporter subunit F1 n=1 Tax=Peribacillus psychrosaccharolyticus TaxID=1407 RepID=A0A974RZE1_PERPY|nr:Na(+)/H(+) antiporter subunit F1 [Peribacillus psychrosaccharolyticus]MEC2055675.1 Na(+)/H(+) antiporter subunit F1 [Peribacillus psychrosaccharolyticus]MED3743298.1 Na(+)/H(+) antiporter subunit F1 [Peribacillus psychrosaccharolyticus]QQS99333.1 Na(+)/H(+) antiporter subunit F1 [Peribacillus psychrosaccharolyticus]